MADVGFRDLGAFVPGRRGEEPVAPPFPPRGASAPESGPPSVIITPAPSAKPARAVFSGDLPSGPDTFGIDAPVSLLAELAAHRGTATPLGIGLLGAPGAGKSFALGRLVQRIRALAEASTPSGPFLPRVHAQVIDAATLDGEPALALAAQLHAGLRQPYPELAREIGHAARDPQAVLRETTEKLDEARRRLDAERRTLEDSGARLARLTETVLYDAAGSQVDSYARANRARIENRLTAFGLTGDPIRNFKDLVNLVTASGNGFGLSVSALHAFKGQTRLLVTAAILALLGFGLGVAFDTQDRWLADLQTGPQVMNTTATWLAAHVDLLVLGRKAAYLFAGLALLVNLARAFGFVRPVLRGARLLETDVENRRRELSGLYAHQTKRADGLAGDVERLTRAVADAEKRAGGPGAGVGAHDPAPFEAGGRAQAQSFFTGLRRLIAEDGPKPEPRAPQRIVLALDHLDAVAPERARAILDMLHRAAADGGLVTIVAADPVRLGLSRDAIERWIQVPLRLDAAPAGRDYAGIIGAALGQAPAPAAPGRIEAARSALDEPVSPEESALLAALAPLAGPAPRAIKRFVNLYTLARLGGTANQGLLALMLALDQGGMPAERQAVEAATDGQDRAARFEPADATPRLRAALAAVQAMDGRATKEEAAAALARSAPYSIASGA